MSNVGDFLDKMSEEVESHSSMQFDNIGDGVKGVVLRSALVDVPDPKRGTRTNLVVDLGEITVKGNVRDNDNKKRPATTGETVTLWLYGGKARAVAKAVKAAGRSEVEKGATLSIKFTGEQEVDKPQPLKLYSATYEPPKQTTPVDDFDTNEEPF